MALSLFTNADPTFKALDRAFDRALANAFQPLGAMPQPTGALSCPCDITEQNDKYLIVADTPGLTDKDVKVELHENVLVVSGERNQQHETKTKDGKVWRQERAFTKFTRSFALPEDAALEGISARMEHGVLTVSVPKAAPPPKPEPKKIRVQMVEDKKAPAVEASHAAESA